MRLGSFWGMTAPMLVAANPDLDFLREVFNSLNTPISMRVLQDLRIELQALSQVTKVMKFDFTDEYEFLNQHKLDCCVKGGFVYLGDRQDLLFQAQVIGALNCVLVDMIVVGERKGSFVSIPGSGSLVDRISDLLTRELLSKDFSLCDFRREVRRVYKSIVSDEGYSIVPQIIEDFQLEVSVVDEVLIDGELIKLSESVKKVCLWYLQHLSTVIGIRDLISISALEEEVLFGSYFIDLIKRNPDSLMYYVANRFDFVKNKHSASLLRSVISEIQSDLGLYKECLGKYVEVYSDQQQQKILNKDVVAELLSVCPCAKSDFFIELERSKVIRMSDFRVSDFELLLRLYDLVEKTSFENLCEEFGIACSREEFSVLSRELCKFGICGLNLFPLRLFRESISTISLVKGTKVMKDAEQMERIYSVLDTIESLLSSLKPIGEEI